MRLRLLGRVDHHVHPEEISFPVRQELQPVTTRSGVLSSLQALQDLSPSLSLCCLQRVANECLPSRLRHMEEGRQSVQHMLRLKSVMHILVIVICAHVSCMFNTVGTCYSRCSAPDSVEHVRPYAPSPFANHSASCSCGTLCCPLVLHIVWSERGAESFP